MPVVYLCHVLYPHHSADFIVWTLKTPPYWLIYRITNKRIMEHLALL
jgi:predicted metal-dependent hydrolase